MLKLLRNVVACLFLICTVCCAGDWPQILGQNRNGIAAEDEKLLGKWEKDGPKQLWEREVGSGYAGLAVAGDVAVLFHRVKNEEVVELVTFKREM